MLPIKEETKPDVQLLQPSESVIPALQEDNYTMNMDSIQTSGTWIMDNHSDDTFIKEEKVDVSDHEGEWEDTKTDIITVKTEKDQHPPNCAEHYEDYNDYKPTTLCQGNNKKTTTTRRHNNNKTQGKHVEAETDSSHFRSRRKKLVFAKTMLYTCHICKKQFRTERAFWNHKRLLHSSCKQFVCISCGHGFKEAISLRTHMLGHYSNVPYSCNTCGKQFEWKFEWKEHISLCDTNNTHSGNTDRKIIHKKSNSM